MMPGYMRGIINLRGRVVPVIDLAVRFGRSRTEETRRTCIVILEVEQQEARHDIGVVVDAVSAVLEIADADIEPAPTFGAKLRTDFINGMGKMGEKFVILLDIGKVLSMEELAMLGEAGSVQAPVAQLAAAQSAQLAAPGAGQAGGSAQRAGRRNQVDEPAAEIEFSGRQRLCSMWVAGNCELPAPFVGGEYPVLPERIGRAGGNHEQRAHALPEFGDGESIRSGPTRLLWAGGSASIGIGLMRKKHYYTVA